MALLTPDYLQTKTYAAKRDRRVNQAGIMQEGIVNAGDFKVAQRGAGANMSVDVALGEAWVDGDFSVDQGFYHVVNDATVNVAIANNASGNPRIDTIVLKVNDSADAGSGSDTPALEVVQGTPTAAATLANLKGIAALPATALRLAYVLVANGAVKIETASIGNLVDPRRGTTGYPAEAEPKAVTLAPAQYAHGRPLGYVPAVRVRHSAEQTPGIRTANAFNTELYDTEEMHSTVENTGRLVCRTPGFYLISFDAEFAISENILIGVNGTAEANDIAAAQTPAPLGGVSIHSITTVYRLGYGDYVNCYQGASALKVFGASTPVFSMHWQGP